MRSRGAAISDFEFNSVVIAILIAFAFSEILSSWGRIIRRLPAVTMSWLYLATSALMLLGLVGHWLGLSEYRTIESFSPAQSLLVFAPSFVGALAAFVLAPELSEPGTIDLPRHYHAIARWVFPLFALFSLLAGMSDRLVLQKDILPFWLYVVRSAALLLPAFSSQVWLHAAVLVFSVVAPVAFFLIA